MPMAMLKAACEAAGFAACRTYLASGNVVFASQASAETVRSTLQTTLTRSAGRPVALLVRSAGVMAATVAENPFPDAAPERTLVVFRDEPWSDDGLGGITGQTDEVVRSGHGVLFVHYPRGVGRSRLSVPATLTGTARNMNTVTALAKMASTLEAAT